MKIRFLIIASLGLVFGQSPDASGFISPAKPALPNYDKRAEATSVAAVAASPEQERAAALLKSRVPNLRISKDQILGTPRLVSASRGFLTGPNGEGKGLGRAYLEALPADEPHRVIKAFLNEHSALFGHDADALASAKVKRDYVTKHNGLRTTVWEQTLDDIPVFEGLLVGHVTREGELVNISSHFVPDVAKAADAGTPNRKSLMARPKISAAKAVVNAASNIGAEVEESSVAVAEAPQGAEKRQAVEAGNLRGKTWAQLVWLPMNPDVMRLCWRVILSAGPRPEFYAVLVDAETGEVLVRHCLTKYISDASYRVFTSDSPSPFSPGHPTPLTTQPPVVSRTLLTLPALSTNASPNGWIDDGVNETRGNNVDAHTDWNADDLPDLPRPAGSPFRVFDFPMDLTTQDPTSYSAAAVVQLFYTCNWMHDRLYELGFTEAAGNFQNNNFGRGGLGNDAVQADAQDGSGYNNANYTPADEGSAPRIQMYIFNGPTPDRDGDLDAEIVMHEYTHGLSDRLVGGGVGLAYVAQSGGLSEGWSDFYPMTLLSEPGDDLGGCYAFGGYATYLFYGLTENYYYGIRRYPYTTDMSKNPLTFKDIDPAQADYCSSGAPTPGSCTTSDADEVHNVGEVWCVTLREVWASLVTKLGWQVGNELVLQLVTDGMKLSPANPNFVEARDAILQADQVDTGGDNYVELWTAFAKRGMGASAQCPASDTTVGVVEAYDLPPNAIPDGILEINITPPSSSVLFYGESVPIFVRVTDARPVTNATIAATVSTGTNLVFRNDGVAPDRKVNDGTYTASFLVPTGQASVTISMVISAPDKDTSTNAVTYFTFAPPPNDNFTNATKVPLGGTNYFTNNKRATLEPGEPVHAGIASAVASLWWNYTPAVNTNVLVDTVGSFFRTVVAVYTNSSLVTLQPVVSAAGSAGHMGAFVVFNARSNLTYHIAVAGYDANNVGTLNLNIAPGGQPDTNAPTVTVTSPPSGVMTNSNRLVLTGTAVDPAPTPSGIKEITIGVSSVPRMGDARTTVVTPIPSLSGPSSTNWSTVISLLADLNSIQVVATDFAGNQSSPFTLQATYRVLEPANDFFVNAIVLTDTSGVSSTNTINATREVGEPNHAGNAGGKSAWWSFTPPADGVLTLNTTNSTFDTLLGLYTGARVNALTTIASNDDAYDGVPGGFSQIVQAVRSNQTCQIAVDGYDGAAGVVFLTYEFAPATVYRLSVSNTVGGTVGLSIGNTVVPPSTDVQSDATVALTATPNANYQFDMWDGDVISLNDSLTVVVRSDMSVTAHYRPVVFTDGFESGNLLQLGWRTAGNTPWLVQTNVVAVGQFAARSGVITNSQSSSLILSNYFRAGNGSFDYRVSSEQGFDFLNFYVDGVGLLQPWSGEAGWASYAFPLTAGNHKLEWRYVKDASLSAGQDAAFVDNVILPLVVAPNASAPAHLDILRASDGTFYIQGQGQPDQTYVTEVSTDLTSWESISTNVAVGGFFRVVDTGSLTNQTRYYRAFVPAP